MRRVSVWAASVAALAACGAAGVALGQPPRPPVLPGPPRPAAAPAIPEALAKLVAAIRGQDKAAALAALDELADLGDEAGPAAAPLAPLIGGPDEDLGWRVARALASLGPAAAPAVPALTDGLQAEDPKVRAYSAHALGAIGEAAHPSAPQLLEAAFDPEPLVRRAAQGALRKMKGAGLDLLPQMVKLLHEKEPSVILPALETLAEGGAQAVPSLCEALAVPEARYWACITLGEIGPEAKAAVPHLVGVLQDQDPQVRLQALLALGRIGPAAVEAVPQVVEELENDEFGGARYAAAFTLAQIGEGSAEAAAALEAAAGSPDPFLAMVAAYAAAKLDGADEAKVVRAAQLLAEGLQSDDEHVRHAAAHGLRDLKPPKEIVRPILIEALQHDDPVVAGNIVRAIVELGPETVPDVAEGLAIPALRGPSLMILYEFGAESAPAVPQLVAAFESTTDDPEADAAFRREVALTLAKIGPAAEEAIPALIARLSDAEPRVRYAACYALGQIGPAAAKAVVEPFKQNLAGEDQMLRGVTVWAMLKIYPDNEKVKKFAVPLMIKALEHQQEMVRQEAAATLGQLGELAQPAIAPLQKAAAGDESPQVREAAAKALQALGAEPAPTAELEPDEPPADQDRPLLPGRPVLPGPPRLPRLPRP